MAANANGAMQLYSMGTARATKQFELGLGLHALVLGHGPSNTPDARKRLEKRVTPTTLVVCTRDLCGWDPGLGRVVVVNCDTTDAVDRPFAPNTIRNVFLFFDLISKQRAESRGWTEFACVPPTASFFTGFMALLWVLCNYSVDHLVTLGLDYDAEYMRTSAASARDHGWFASSHDEMHELSLVRSTCQVLQACLVEGATLTTNSPAFYKLMEAACTALSNPAAMQRLEETWEMAQNAMAQEEERFRESVRTGETVQRFVLCIGCGDMFERTDRRDVQCGPCKNQVLMLCGGCNNLFKMPDAWRCDGCAQSQVKKND